MEGVVTYMVMDDLVVEPLSSTAIISLLDKFNVKDMGTLEEKVVELGMDEVCHPFFSCLSMTFIYIFYYRLL